MARVVIIVPCYNESDRLDCQRFQTFMCNEHKVVFLFVDDGSTDKTAALLATLRDSDSSRFGVLSLTDNQGKAEAVRQGFLQAFESNPKYVGFWDADLATPLSAIPKFLQLLDEHAEVEIVFGSRVKLLGRQIQRRAVRHYLGRLFATVVSITLGVGIYDSQCGAKLFRVSPSVKELFRLPFISRWIFDVEIIARLIQARRGQDTLQVDKIIHEIPLMEWRDIRGSKIKATDFLIAIFDILQIYYRYVRSSPKLSVAARIADGYIGNGRRK